MARGISWWKFVLRVSRALQRFLKRRSVSKGGRDCGVEGGRLRRSFSFFVCVVRSGKGEFRSCIVQILVRKREGVEREKGREGTDDFSEDIYEGRGGDGDGKQGSTLMSPALSRFLSGLIFEATKHLGSPPVGKQMSFVMGAISTRMGSWELCPELAEDLLRRRVVNARERKLKEWTESKRWMRMVSLFLAGIP